MAEPAQRRPKRQIHKAVSKKRKFVKDGVFYAELNDFLANELSEQGYAGCGVRVTPQRTEIIIRATNSSDVIGENGRRIRELTALIQKRFKFPKNGLICFAEKVRNKGFSALTQAQAVKYRLLTGLTVRRAAYSCLKYIMDSEKKNGALGCEIIVSGKLRGQRAKGMKFRDGFMIHAGNPSTYYIDTAVKHVHLPQGVIGIKVKIMKPYDSTGRDGVPIDLPDKVQILDPKDDAFEQDVLATDRQEMATHLSQFNRPTQQGPGPQAPQQPQVPQQPQPPMADNNNMASMQQAPQGGGYDQGFNQQGNNDLGGQAQQPVNDNQFVEQTQQQGGNQFAQPVQSDFNQQQQYNAQPQQFEQYGAQQTTQQFQQFDNQYQQPMQQQYQAPVQQQYNQQGSQNAQSGQFEQNQGQGQYYDQNRNNYQY